METSIDLIVSEISEGIALLRFNRPKQLNALSLAVIEALVETLERLDADPSVGCFVLTGDERAFAAGADIGDMAMASASEMVKRNQFANWERIRAVKKPIIAAVNGFALGGGCELAMLCDFIIAGDTAKFGQPEINLGVIPGAGGTQRLIRAIGKAKAMHLILTGETLSAQQAFDAGLVAKVVPTEFTVREAVSIAKSIAAKSTFAVRMAKEAVNAADELSLTQGLQLERKNFYLLFGMHDQREGMAAFLEKRKPKWEKS